MNKSAKILEHMKLHGSITQMEAWDIFRASRLSALIFLYKARGYNIESVWEHGVNKDGERTRWTRYYLKEGEAI